MERCLYKRGSLILTVYVDDLLYTSRIRTDLEKLEKDLTEKFKVTVHESVKEFLGFQVKTTTDGLVLHQHK